MFFKKRKHKKVSTSRSGNRVEWALSNPMIWRKLNQQAVLRKNKK